MNNFWPVKVRALKMATRDQNFTRTNGQEEMGVNKTSPAPQMNPQAYHPLFVLRTCATCASVVYKGFCEYDNWGFLNG